MKVPSWLVEEGTTASELIRFAQQVQYVGGLGGYQFHGVGGEFFRIPAASHRAMLVYLRAHPELYQLMTFSQAMDTLLHN